MIRGNRRNHLLRSAAAAVFCASMLILWAGSLASYQRAFAAPLSIWFSNVTENQILAGDYEVVVGASDTSLVSNIKLWVDDTTFIKQENYSPYEFPVDTTDFADGPHVLKAIATDKSGNTAAATATVTAIFDNDIDPGGGGGGGGSTVTIVMQDTTSTTGQSLWSGRPVHAEYVSASSALVGKEINSITMKLKKVSSASGTAEIGIINSDLSMKKVFGTKSASTVATSYTDYEFVLPAGESYTIQAGDRIGAKYTAGTSSNYLAVMRDTNSADPFDGTNTYHTYYTTSWSSFTSNDLTMTLKLIGSGSTQPPPPPTGGDTTPPSVAASHSPSSPSSTDTVTFTASASDNAGLSSIEIFVDGTSLGSCAVSSLSANCIKSAGPYSSGSSHTYYATAKDAAGLTTASSTGSFSVATSPPPPNNNLLPTAESIFNTETLTVPHHVSHFIVVNPTHSHHDTSSSWIAPTNAFYLPSNLIISQSTAVTLLAWDDHGIHQMQAKRADNGAIEWTTSALANKQYSSPPRTFSAATTYNIQDVYAASGYSYDQSHMKGTITTQTPSAATDGTIAGAMYIPQSFDRSKITLKGLTIESEYNFYKVWKHLPYDNTLVIYSSKQSLPDTLADLQAIIDEVGYD